MKKYLILLLLTACSYNKIDEYPLAIIGKENYSEPNFKYEKIRTIEDEYCTAMYLSLYIHFPQDMAELVTLSLNKFKVNHTLAPNEYLINIRERRGKFSIIPIIYSKLCRVIEMDLVRKIGD